MTDLTSRQNPRIKLARSLHQRKARQETGLFLVEGLRHLGELVDSSYKVEFVLYSPDTLTSTFGHEVIDRFRTLGVQVFTTTEAILDDLSGKNSALGALAVVHQSDLDPSSISPDVSRPTVALVAPQDPGNIGSILRTMDAVRAGALFLLEGGADPWQPTAVRASMGSIFWHPVVQCSFDAFAGWAAANVVHVYGTSTKGSDAFTETSGYAQPSALLLGSEREGLSYAQAEICEKLVRIPMQGRGSSLNLAVAAGVLLYAMSLQK